MPSSHLVTRPDVRHARGQASRYRRARGLVVGAAAALAAAAAFVALEALVLDRPAPDLAAFATRVMAATIGIEIILRVARGSRRRSESAVETGDLGVPRALALHQRVGADLIFRYRILPVPGFEYVSPSAETMVGYTPAELYADPAFLAKLIVPGDAPIVAAVAAGHGAVDDPIVIRWRHRDGSLIWTEQKIRQIRDPDGALVALEGCARDISGRTRARDEAVRLRRIIGDAFEQVLILDATSFEVIDATPGAARALRCTRDQVLALTVDALFPGIEATRFLDLARNAQLGAEAQPPLELSARRPDGSRLAVRVRVSAIPDGDGRTVVAYLEDITTEVARGAKLRRLAVAVDVADDMIVIADRARSIVFVNPSFALATGWSATLALGHHPEMLGSRADAAMIELAWDDLRAGSRWSGTLGIHRADGSSLDALATITLVRDRAGEVDFYVVAMRDLTPENALRIQLLGERTGEIERATAATRIVSEHTMAASLRAVAREIQRHDPSVIAAIVSMGPRGPILLAGVGFNASPHVPIHSFAADVSYAAAMGVAGTVALERPPADPFAVAAARVGRFTADVIALRDDDAVVGAIAIARAGPASRERTAAYSAWIMELGALGSVTLGAGLAELAREDHDCALVDQLIAEHRYHPVFQPIVRLAGGDPIGWEALTRFETEIGTRDIFEMARRTGRGVEMEAVTLHAAIEAAEAAGTQEWVGINVSGDNALSERAMSAIQTTSLSLVLEIDVPGSEVTRDLVRRLGPFAPRVRLATNRPWHLSAVMADLISLRPAFAKVPVPLLRNASRDPFGRALILTTGALLERSGCQIIAVGIESVTDIEIAAAFKIRLGQGFYLGSPAQLRPAGRSSRSAA